MSSPTRVPSEQIKFRSTLTGEHSLDIYLEDAELGGRTLAQLLAQLYDAATGDPISGQIRLYFLGSRESDPVPDGLGNPAEGAVYYNTTDSELRLYNGANWVNIAFNPGAGGTLEVEGSFAITELDAAQVPLTVQGAVGQTANLQEWSDSTGQVVARVDPLGKWAFTTDGTFYGPGINDPEPRASLALAGNAPAIDMIAVGIPDTHKLTRLQKTTTGFRIVKGDNDGNALQELYDVAIDSSGAVSHTWNIGAASPVVLDATGLTVDADVTTNGNFRSASPSVPASAVATGSAGEIAWDADYIYVCTAANTWKRAALSTW